MKTLISLSKITVSIALVLWLFPAFFLVTIAPGTIGVRQSSLSGVDEEDLTPGWHWQLPGMHKIIVLPSNYDFLDYTPDDIGPQGPLQIRTKDNNIVQLDVSVPVRISEGGGDKLVRAGNHVRDADGRHRFQRLAEETTVSVLREHLAELDSVGFYTTSERVRVSQATLEVLNKALEELHLEAEAVLIRAVRFREEYENQLQQIQLNEQNKLLDQARQRVAAQQQELDNFQQGTNALAAAREQNWIKRQAELERAYEVGFVEGGGDNTPGAARRAMESLDDTEKLELRRAAAEVLGIAEVEDVDEAYLLGIKNIEAETREYSKRVLAEANAVAGRLAAEGEAKIAKVQGEFETKINALLNSPAGRAYVAWKTAENVTFNETLTFQSSDGIPSVLRLRDFALKFMGR